MSDFDLSQALESSTEDTCIFTGGVQEEIRSVDVGLDLVDYIQRPISIREALPGYISVRRISMRGISMLAVALKRMKPFRNAASSDEHMDMISVQGLLDDTDNIVRTIHQDVHSSSSKKKIRFRRRTFEECTLSDTKQKNLFQFNENQLLATTLKGGSQKVKVKLTRYTSNHGNMRPVVFTIVINDIQHHICCSGQEPVLKHEACSETKLEEQEELTAGGDTDRFLFYMKKTGSLTTFESVKHRGWFISTSLEENQPVQMCKKDTTSRDIYFSK